MEVILIQNISKRKSVSILHVCGGDPQFDHNVYKWKEVFSAYVEVIPKNVILSKSINCILHVCGGDPKLTHLTSEKLQYSPRMWRWSLSFALLKTY